MLTQLASFNLGSCGFVGGDDGHRVGTFLVGSGWTNWVKWETGDRRGIAVHGCCGSDGLRSL